MQARLNVKMCLSIMVRGHTNSYPSYVRFLTCCSLFILQSRLALSSSQADFDVTRSVRKFINRAFCISCTRLHERIKLPDFIRKSASLSLCKTNLKTYLLKIY